MFAAMDCRAKKSDLLDFILCFAKESNFIFNQLTVANSHCFASFAPFSVTEASFAVQPLPGYIKKKTAHQQRIIAGGSSL